MTTTGSRAGRRRPAPEPPDGLTMFGSEDDVAVVDRPADPMSAARTICLRLLTIRPRTRAELAEALSTRDVPADAITKVLDRFTEVGLIDDAAFAASFVQTRHRDRGLSRRILSHELAKRGIAAEQIEVAIEPIDDDAELATARGLVARRLRSMQSLAPDVQTRRLVGMLARKGYSAGVCYAAIRLERSDLAADSSDLAALVEVGSD